MGDDCKAVRAMGDYFWVCNPKTQEKQDAANLGGWLACKFSCSNYTGPANYKWDTGACVCSGLNISAMWRKR